jgi:ketosteroid isomerase-like protein
MGPGENAEIVRRGYQAFNAGDVETLTELFDESASWHSPGRGPLAGDYVGREAVFGYFGQLGGQTAERSGPHWSTCPRVMTAA